MFLIRDENGAIYNTVENPTVVFSIQTGTMLKIGELADMQFYFAHVQSTYRSNGLDSEADSVGLLELPKDQVEIDKVFQITGYVGLLFRRLKLN